MELDQAQWDEIEQLAGSGFTVRKIAMYLKQDPDFFQAEYEDPDSLLRLHFDRGMLENEAKRDIELCRSASSGSISAIQILEKKLEQRKLELFKEHLLNGS